MNSTNDSVTVDRLEVINRAAACLEKAGSSTAEAALVAECLVSADVRGVISHGLIRLPIYAEAVLAGGIVADAPMEWVRETGSTAVLNAHCGFGQTAMDKAITKGAAMAKTSGSATIAVNNSSHYGAGAVWTDRLAAQGLIGFLVSTTGPLVAPYGAKDRLLGSNPLSLSFPTPGDPVTLDMATSSAAFGKVKEAYGAGRSIPDDWAIDSDGAATTDAAAAMEGALVPFGGHKGSGIAVLVELLAGAAAGGRFASETTDLWSDRSANTRTGHFLLVVDPAGMLGDDSARQRAWDLQQDLRRSAPAAGVSAVQSPGDPELANAQANGGSVTIPSHIYQSLETLEQQLAGRQPVPDQVG